MSSKVGFFFANSIWSKYEKLNFLVDRSLIGFSELQTDLQSPSGIKLPFKIDSSINHKVRFIAREEGVHKFCIRLGDNPIKGNLFFL